MTSHLHLCTGTQAFWELTLPSHPLVFLFYFTVPSTLFSHLFLVAVLIFVSYRKSSFRNEEKSYTNKRKTNLGPPYLLKPQNLPWKDQNEDKEEIVDL